MFSSFQLIFEERPFIFSVKIFQNLEFLFEPCFFFLIVFNFILSFLSFWVKIVPGILPKSLFSKSLLKLISWPDEKVKFIRVGSELLEVKEGLILFELEFVNLRLKVGKKNMLIVQRVSILKEDFDIIFGNFAVIVLVNTIKHKLQYTFSIHQTKNCNP